MLLYKAKGSDEMNERIKALRRKLGLNQTDFGIRIGIKQGSIASYESGVRTPLDTVITSICREFNVNEEWLRTGNGDMFVQLSRDEEIAVFAGKLLSTESDDFKHRFIGILAQLDESGWEALEQTALNFSRLFNQSEENKKS